MISYSWQQAIRPLLILAVLTSACASGSGEHDEAIAQIEQRHSSNQAWFAVEKARLAASIDLNAPREFGDLGVIELRRLELTGWASAASLRAEFTWVNTGPETRQAPIVVLWVEDPEGGARESASLALSVTYGLRYGTGSTHAAWLDVPTNGLERVPGWKWGIELRAPDRGSGGALGDDGP